MNVIAKGLEDRDHVATNASGDPNLCDPKSLKTKFQLATCRQGAYTNDYEDYGIFLMVYVPPALPTDNSAAVLCSKLQRYDLSSRGMMTGVFCLIACTILNPHLNYCCKISKDVRT